MTPSLPFSAILRANRAGRGKPYALLPSRHRSAWLLPADPALRRIGLRAFGHRGLKGFMGRTVLAANQLRGQRLWLDVGQLERRLAGVLGEPAVDLAFCIGTSSPYRKLTVQVMSGREQVAAYAKIAARGLAQDALACEHQTLLRLSASDGLRHHVPTVLGWFGWQGARVLVVTAGGGPVGPARLTEQHGEFLQRLHEASAEERPFEAGAMWARLVGTVQRLAPSMPREWVLRSQAALRRLTGLGPIVLPLTIAHRDFAPWNTRLAAHGLFVFDWETAADGMTPLYDIFHFQAIQAAHAGRPFHPAPRGHQELSGTFWARWHPHHALLYLAYLLDMGLFYLEAQLLAPGGADARVCRWFGEQIDACAGCGHAVA